MVPVVNHTPGHKGIIGADWWGGTQLWESEISTLELEHLDLLVMRKPAIAPLKCPASNVSKLLSVAPAESVAQPTTRPASLGILAPPMKVLKSLPRKLEHARV